ncbi:MAG TPA: diadenylate cyclase CdaA [Erysipelotrichaceae bacterium]|nr:diadenylate cyclase CdaA [Erysipelotrichaceae bacterium]HQA85191.1 diadenylate cyclase CdaA [Erysipelotrichaceae bacterium]
MHISLTYESIIHYLQVGIDIIAVWIVLNYLIKVVRTNQKTIQIFQGILLIVIVQSVSKLLGLTTVAWLANNIVSWGFLAIIVIFQPEIRSILERLGKSNALARIATLTSTEKESLIDELMAATANLTASKTGALITLEQAHSLEDYVNTGIRMNSLVSAELICSIFMTTTPLHDGAVIIQGDKLSCASAYFPPTTMDLPAKYGARHRAAIGISEISDAVTIVVSEETGRVSVAEQGKLIQMNERKLRAYLERIVLNKENISGESRPRTSSVSVSIDDLVNKFEKEFERLDQDIEIENQLSNLDSHEMKNFNTISFKTIDFEEEDVSEINAPKKLVESLISSTLAENTVDENVTVRKVAVPKGTTSNTGGINVIKTTSVTTGTDKIEKTSGKGGSENV